MSALITGGGGSLGLAIGLAFAARGVPVALLDRDISAAEQAAAEICAKTAAKAEGFVCDVTEPEQIERSWAAASEALGVPDIVVNNAGRFVSHEFTDLPLEVWEETLALQLTGPFLVCRQAARSWIANGVQGAIVNVSSNAAAAAHEKGSADYGASKAGLVGLTVDLAVELGPHGIRANSVLPGTFRSRLNAERLADAEAARKESANVPMRRLGEPQEIAAAVVFLAMEGTYTNGAALSCDGGTMVRLF